MDMLQTQVQVEPHMKYFKYLPTFYFTSKIIKRNEELLT